MRRNGEGKGESDKVQMRGLIRYRKWGVEAFQRAKRRERELPEEREVAGEVDLSRWKGTTLEGAGSAREGASESLVRIGLTWRDQLNSSGVHLSISEYSIV